MPPNIVLINVDDLGWTDLACFGSKYYETPNIDRLCSRGMKFTNAYAAAAVCSPSRAAIMTGRYPSRIGITDWIRFRKYIDGTTNPGPDDYEGDGTTPLLCPANPHWMELEEVTIAEMLKPVGYITGHIGKWHLGFEAYYPEKQGFDFNVGGCHLGQPPSYFDPYERKAKIPTLMARKTGEYLTDRLADEAVKFITAHKDEPFFLHLAHYAVHTPLEGKSDLVAKYEAKPKTNQSNPQYAAMIESVDDSVGQIVETLDRLELTDRTLIIFTSDNGGLSGSTDNSPLRDGKGYPYEGGIRIPQIIRWPGMIEPGTVCDVPVTSVDFLPTIAEATGADLPDTVIDGESLMPLLRQTGSLERDAIFWHFPHYRENGDVAPYSIIRQGKWKLIKWHEGKESELFNLEEDISEQRNLTPEMPEKVTELDKRLVAWLHQTNARLPKPNPGFKRSK